MGDDDDWETDADFENNLTEEQQRAYGNAETMAKYQSVMDKAAGSVAPGSYESRVAAPTAAPPRGGSTSYLDVSDAPAPPPPPVVPAAARRPSYEVAPPQQFEVVPPPQRQASTPKKIQLPAMCSGGSTDAALSESSTPSAPSAALKKMGSSGGAVMQRHRCASMSGDQQMKQLFASFDTNRDGVISVDDELPKAMERLGMEPSEKMLSAIVAEVDTDGDGQISYGEFVSVVERMKTAGGNHGAKVFGAVVDSAGKQLMQDKHENIVHSFAEDECAAFVDFINAKLGNERDVQYLLPMTQLTQLFSKIADGVLLCKLINVAAPETIDERVINNAPPNKFLITENLNLALNAAKSLGVKVVNIGSSDLIEGRPHLVLGLIWQIVKMALLSKINLKENPNLIRLLEEGETLENIRKMSPEKLLMRWFNYHLAEAGVSKRVTNFGNDLADSELYLHLMSRIDPERKATATVLTRVADKTERAKLVVQHGKRMGAEFNISPQDITSGNDKLNLGFVAALFNAVPDAGLLPPEAEEAALLEDVPEENEGDSREERAFRMWINSLGLDTQVNNLIEECYDGLLILETMDKINPGVVDWKKVDKKPKNVHNRIINCNYAVELGKERRPKSKEIDAFAFSLVGIDGKDIVDKKTKLILAIVWQVR